MCVISSGLAELYIFSENVHIRTITNVKVHWHSKLVMYTNLQCFTFFQLHSVFMKVCPSANHCVTHLHIRLHIHVFFQYPCRLTYKTIDKSMEWWNKGQLRSCWVMTINAADPSQHTALTQCPLLVWQNHSLNNFTYREYIKFINCDEPTIRAPQLHKLLLYSRMKNNM